MRNLIDFWSVPHFMAGVVAALIAVVFAFPPVPIFFATLILAILWELFEARFKLGEVSWNVGSDIALPLIAFPIVYALASRPEVGMEHRVLLLTIASSIYVYTNAISWGARLDGDRDFKS
ncbi:MAG: hypothetical protein KBD19_01495 [Candidatus Moranbacteria bacterium]|nr:hypothetical protein [Candidatus Moranbacteria bacterium]